MSSSDPDATPETPADAPAVAARGGPFRTSPFARSMAGSRPWLTPEARVFLARWGAALLGAITACIITGRAHWHFIRPYATPVSNDEGYITAMALRMVHGHWL